MNPFGILVRAFRAAVRSEVERAMADRRAALRQAESPEIADLKRLFRGAGLTVVDIMPAGRCERPGADVIPFPAANTNHSEPPPSAA